METKPDTAYTYTNYTQSNHTYLPHDDHSENHGHHHGGPFHSHAPLNGMKTAFVITLLILLVEIAGGLISNSLALLSDAGHVMTDLAAIGLSWYALHQGQKPATAKMTYGYHRTGILAALTNAVTLIVIALILIFESYGRFLHPQHVGSIALFISAGIGLLANLWMGMSMKGSHDINVKSAVLHMIGDAVASAGVILGGLVMQFTGWYIIDPILTVLIACMISYGAWGIIKQAVGVLMESTPNEINIGETTDVILGFAGVQEVHDLHVWSITPGKNVLSCHIVLDGQMTIRESQSLLRDIEHKLFHAGIRHVTIQVEDSSHPHDNSVFCVAVEVDPHR